MLRISADPAELEVGLIHGFLSRSSYWAADIPLPTLERALANSVCYGGYVDGAQVAFARAVTDQATFAYLADVFVVPDHRGKGYGRDIVRALMQDSRLQGLRRWHLVTRDMQGLYGRLGFTALDQPELHMQKHDPDVYRRAASKPA
ncbi:GNAT family N-acetyltransferase [Pseudoxanthomonas yeongjuensis]|jgi:GNAT superfamily N-acetyltransferase|uniref:GNAT family N-acetyltransferase n=1 Tax=Pseudoxanthomonas yeongjuensis TaxID=377616 RepID=UPI00139177DC|nr:GNAT family N-acetyltransferase [Pseudoxanthomonas yeongjuensis]KAF1717874.1 GNAT family N-acetyltransferase [Pseudoxanthomonas yeongjuensis]